MEITKIRRGFEFEVEQMAPDKQFKAISNIKSSAMMLMHNALADTDEVLKPGAKVAIDVRVAIFPKE